VAHGALVAPETINRQKTMTKSYKLKNRIPVTYREVPGSSILSVSVSFSTGLKDQPKGRKVLGRWLTSAMTIASKEYSKDKVYAVREKFAIDLNCSAGVEITTCDVGTLNEYWKDALALFSSLVIRPTFPEADANIVKDRLVSQLKRIPQAPDDYINEIVNRAFYPADHPFRLDYTDALAELESLTIKDLKEAHAQLINSNNMRIVVVGSYPSKDMIKQLDTAFGDIAAASVKPVEVPLPRNDKSKAYIFEHREIPTAYIRLKFNAPSAIDAAAPTSRLLFEILSEELWEEIRTKQSLSYSVYAATTQYSRGIGALSATTSKPRETLAALATVIQKVKTKTYTPEEIEEYKRTFATSYYRGQETHDHLADSIVSGLFYFGSTDPLYELPKRLDEVTPADIRKLANQILTQMTIGVLYDRKKFEDDWAKQLLESI